MAPRRGSRSSSSYYPDELEATALFGRSSASLYSDSKLRGLLILSTIWVLALSLLLLRTLRLLKTSTTPRWIKCLQLTLAFLLLPSILLCLRYGILPNKSLVGTSYRFESSI
jgi:hypothetical protein